MAICIYCKKQKGNFNSREHVIPQAFGRFQPDNFVLNDRQKKRDKKVCEDCNFKLGRELDENLARGSHEGYILRPKFLKNDPHEKALRNIITIRGSTDPFKGAYFKLMPNDMVEPLPQIGLRKKDGNWDYFLANEPVDFDKTQYDLTDNSLCAFGLDEDAAAEQFNKLGIKYIPSTTFPIHLNNEKGLFNIEFNITQILHRAFTKIAFNYFSYFNYKYIILNPIFDQIRDYVLDSSSNVKVPINISNDAILLNDSNNERLLGHIITIIKNRDGNLLAQVSLFNYRKYTIMLAEAFDHKKLHFGFGHFFNVSNGKIVELNNRNIEK